jgi:hypothetical protein
MSPQRDGNRGKMERGTMAETPTTDGRETTDGQGRNWLALAVETPVAHLKKGALLGFRPVDDPQAGPLRTSIQFNSRAAAELALRTMSEKELRRRLQWAMTDAGLA